MILKSLGELLKAALFGALQLIMILGSPGRTVTVEAALAAVQEEPLESLEMDKSDLADQSLPDTHLANSYVDLTYKKTIRGHDNATVETISLVLTGYSGGLMVTLVNDKVVSWTRNAAYLSYPQLSPRTLFLVGQILQEVRERVEELGGIKQQGVKL